jgi:TolB-like protein
VATVNTTPDSLTAVKHLAILPFANYSDHADAMALFEPIIRNNISGDFILVPAENVEKDLRRYRIRSTAEIGLEDASRMAKDLGINYFMLGSIDVFLPGEIPEAAISARVINANNMSVLWASSVASSGSDYVKILELGKVTSMEELARRLILELFADFNIQRINDCAERMANQTGQLHAVVVFDNLSSNKAAGNIVTAMTISDLLKNKIPLLEPGVVTELFRQNGQSLRGEIELGLLRQLYEKFNINRIITGTVDIFQPGSANVEGGTPEVEVGARYLDASTGKILMAAEVNRRGSDSETIFGRGVTHSLGKLARDATHSILEKLHVYDK